MNRPLVFALSVALLCGVSASSVPAQVQQLGSLINGKKKADPNAPVDLSNVDKDKIQRIEQMPEVQDAIQQEWDQLRRTDMQLAYGVNLTESLNMAQDARGEDAFDRQRLYGNPVAQSYINHVGQRLVPKNSTNVYTFRILYDPIPKALTLTTGTIYVSTGLLSMITSEGELSYVLAHEIAHVELRQAYLRIRDKHVAEELAREKAEKEKIVTDVASTAVGLGLGGAMIPMRLGAAIGGSAGLATGVELGHYFIHPQIEPVIWGGKEEDDADEMAARLVLDQGYDIREAMHLFASLNQIVSADSRMGLGFMGSAPRIKGRQGFLQTQINGPLKAEIDSRVKGKGFNPNSPDFAPTVSSVQRDNGILAMDYDLFAVSKHNLDAAVKARADDPTAQFYLAKLERLTARTPAERQEALDHLTTALKLDADRGAIPAAHLEYAVALMEQDDPGNQSQIASELKAYVALSERDRTGLPANMPVIYDYLSGSGDTRWYLPPQWYGAQLTSNPGFTATAPEAVIRKASTLEGPAPSAPAAAPATSPSKSKVKTAAAAKNQPATAEAKPTSAN